MNVVRQQLNQQAHVVVVICQISQSQTDSWKLETLIIT